MVLRRENSRWRALAVSKDVLSTKEMPVLCRLDFRARVGLEDPPRPRLIYPADGKTIGEGGKSFAWEVPPGGEPLVAQVCQVLLAGGERQQLARDAAQDVSRHAARPVATVVRNAEGPNGGVRQADVMVRLGHRQGRANLRLGGPELQQAGIQAMMARMTTVIGRAGQPSSTRRMVGEAQTRRLRCMDTRGVRPEIGGCEMLVSDAQREVLTVYLGGFVGQLVSAMIWLASAAIATVVDPKTSFWSLAIGGAAIFPLTQVLLRMAGRRAAIGGQNPMGHLVMQIAFLSFSL